MKRMVLTVLALVSLAGCASIRIRLRVRARILRMPSRRGWADCRKASRPGAGRRNTMYGWQNGKRKRQGLKTVQSPIRYPCPQIRKLFEGMGGLLAVVEG